MLRPSLLTSLMLVATVTAATAQEQKPTVPVADYGKWEYLGRGALSPRGDWLAAPIRRVDEDRILRLRRVGSDSVVVIAHGDRPAFSNDGRWVAYAIGVSPKERAKLTKAKKPVQDALG
ncbi:MAG TPA: hypothetical protein VJ992_00630, partial [Gemmatimonadales bacterium]|nr:hypothetical protein [Gemmatimonadales bacterium]